MIGLLDILFSLSVLDYVIFAEGNIAKELNQIFLFENVVLEAKKRQGVVHCNVGIYKFGNDINSVIFDKGLTEIVAEG